MRGGGVEGRTSGIWCTSFSHSLSYIPFAPYSLSQCTFLYPSLAPLPYTHPPLSIHVSLSPSSLSPILPPYFTLPLSYLSYPLSISPSPSFLHPSLSLHLSHPTLHTLLLSLLPSPHHLFSLSLLPSSSLPVLHLPLPFPPSLLSNSVYILCLCT